MKMNDTEYVCASARVRARENTLLSRETFSRMTEARSVAEVLAIFAECGFSPVTAEGTDAVPDTEATIGQLTVDARTLLAEVAPDPALFDFLYQPIDCHNAKSVLKCAAAGTDPAPLMMAGGTADAAALCRELQAGRTELLPAHMAAAYKTAGEVYAATHDPRKIDLLLDAACFRDMEASAAGDAFLAQYMRMRVDLTNLLTLLRIIRRYGSEGGALAVSHAETLLREALLPGGTLSDTFYASAVEGGEATLGERIRATSYARIAAAVDFTADSPETVEIQCDLESLRYVRDAMFVPFGPAVLLAYAVRREAETKNMRVILAAKRMGLPPDRIRPRLRLL